METLFEGKKLYAVIIIFLLIITFSVIFNNYKYVSENAIAENRLTANLFSTLIYEHQKAAIGILESYAQYPLFIDAAKKKDFHQIIHHLESLSKHHTEMDALFISDQYGTVWANYPVSKESYGKNLAYRDWYKGVSRKWRPYISTVFRLIVLEKDLAIAVSVPILDRKGKVIGILGSTQRIAFLATFIRANTMDPKKSITILDQEGNIIFSNTIPHQKNITKYPDARILEKTDAGVITNMEIADAKEKGGISYVSIAPVKGIGWSVIVGQEKGAILKSLYGYFIRSAVTGIVIFLFLTVCLLYFRREYKYRKTKELLQAEQKYRNIFNDAILGIYQTSPEGRILSVNPALARMHGYDTPEELINSMTDIATQSYVNPEDREIFKRILSKEGVVKKFETRLCKKGGETIWVSINARAVKGTQGNITHYEGTVEDITERKQAEEALRESGKRFRQIAESVGEWIWEVDADGLYTYTNPAVKDILGYKPDEIVGKMHFYDFFVPEEREELKKTALKTFAKKWVFRGFVNQCLHKNGNRVILETSGVPSLDEKGRLICYRGADTDITERKRTEEALLESESKFRTLFETAKDAIFLLDQYIFTDCNLKTLEIFGCTREQIIGQTPYRFSPEVQPDGRNSMEKAQEKMEAAFRGQKQFFEWKHSRYDGTPFDAEVSLNIFSTGGKNYLQAVVHDITERKLAEEALRESAEKYQRFFMTSRDCVFITSKDGNWIDTNDAAVELFGYSSREELIQVKIPNLYVNPEERVKHSSIIAELGYCKEFPVDLRRKDGTVIHTLITSVALYDAEKSMMGFQGTIRDITEHKHVEEKLKDSEKRFATIFLSNPAAITITRTDNSQFVDVNLAWQDVTGYTHAEAVGHTPFELNLWVNPEQRELLIEMLREHGEAQGEIQVRKKSGEIRDMLMSAELSQLTGETYLLTMAQDITERKRVEDELIASLQEKEILIREVHHRTKNNMQVISGLLDLQARPTGNPELTEMLNESQRRIQAMAMIHEKLYGSKNFSRIDLAGYARTLSQELFQAYEITPGKINLVIQNEGEFYVDINKAIPCGLILNELISNTLKHAFPGGEPGTLEIIISKTKNAEVEIVVRDNGLVIPDDVDIHQPRSVGLHLVNGLVIHQLDGRVVIRRDTGTEFRITFPLSFVENKEVL